jgi:hypothetical protein
VVAQSPPLSDVFTFNRGTRQQLKGKAFTF